MHDEYEPLPENAVFTPRSTDRPIWNDTQQVQRSFSRNFNPDMKDNSQVKTFHLILNR